MSIRQNALRRKRADWTDEDIRLIEEKAQAEARESFWAFRQYMHPGMKLGWWQQQVAYDLQQLYEDYLAGKRPKKIETAPPQHGKTSSVEDFIAWLAGKDPKLKLIFTSYGEDLGLRVNTTLQRMIPSPRYQSVFPNTRLPSKSSFSEAHLNSNYMEFVIYDPEAGAWVAAGGSFRNTTVNGQITGHGLDFGFVDDPLKGRKEANSPTIREGTWGWLTDDFFSRFSENAALLMTTTRWHVEDPAGKLISKFPGGVTVCRAPALGRWKDGKWIADKEDGKPLFPELKSKGFILERKALMTAASFEAVYQGSPYVVGGGMFPVENFKLMKRVNHNLIKSSVRYWDKAASEGDTAVAYTAGVLMHEMQDDVEPGFVIEDCVRVQATSGKREKIIKQTADLDEIKYGYGTVTQYIEQEPGSGGKESAENTVRKTLRGHSAIADKVTGDKEIRANPYAAQVEAENVGLVVGPDPETSWVKDFLEEHETAPNGKTKDQWDAAAGAFNKLIGGSGYDGSLSWVGGPGIP